MSTLNTLKPRESRYDLDLAREFNREVEQEERKAALEAKLKGKKEPEQEDKPEPQNLEGFIYIPSVKLYFAKQRSHYNLNWYDTHKAIIPQNLRMPTQIETWELIFYLRDNLDNPELKRVYDDILEKTPKDMWHGEWQNAIFSKEEDNMYIQNVTGINSDGELIYSKKQKLEDCLVNHGWADISQRSNLNSQGLCKISSTLQIYEQGKNIYFWPPVNGSAARFVAGSDRAGIVCDGDPQYCGAGLGVRVVRKR